MRWFKKASFIAALSLLGTAAAHAHDALQANTNIWLRPDKMEVEIIMARAPSRLLVENAPPVPVTVDNFENTYHALFLKNAPTMLEITLDGKKLEPRSVAAAPFEETDIQFRFVYDRPPNGKLQITAAFIKKMGDGYMNSLGLNEDRKVLGYGDQSADSPTWEINLGRDTGIKPPSESSPPPPTPPLGVRSAAKPLAVGPIDAAPHDSYFIIFHLHYVELAVIILLAIWLIRQKSR